MNGVFARRRARLLAMKALRDSYASGEKTFTCPRCGQDSERKLVAQALYVCPKCGHHLPLGAYYRLSTILDPGSFRELNGKLSAADPLKFPGYREKLDAARRKTGLQEAVVTAAGTSMGAGAVVGVMDSRFLMGSMSAAVGEKVTLALSTPQKQAAAGSFLRQRRGPDAGGDFFPDADGQNRRCRPALSERGRAVHLLPHAPHHRRGDGQLCFSGGYHAGRAGGPHRLCRAEGHRADHQGTAAPGLPAG